MAAPFRPGRPAEEGRRRAALRRSRTSWDGCKRVGFAPLPPYIKRAKGDPADRERDLERYQTVFAASEGAIAAPTAGLHFTPEVLERIRAEGVETARVTLHVGLATFQPMRTERIEDHRMLEEIYDVPADAAAAVDLRPRRRAGPSSPSARPSSGRWKAPAGRAGSRPGPGATSLFITPGFEFKIVDRLLTNFHLPQVDAAAAGFGPGRPRA